MPTRAEVVEARRAANMTQAVAGAVVSVYWTTWQRWELSDKVSMPEPLYELFMHKTGQKRIPFPKK